MTALRGIATSSRLAAVLPLLISSLLSCAAEPLVVPVRNLERPSDMGFVCLTVTDKILTGSPMAACLPEHNDKGTAAPKAPEGLNGGAQRDKGTFGLVTNTARGELAVIDLDTGRLLDLDPGSPGFGMLPVGPLPETLSSSTDGCLVVTANRSACNLSAIDPSRVLASRFSGATPSTKVGQPVFSFEPWTATGPLGLDAEEIALINGPVSTGSICDPVGDPARPRLMLATFPSCDLVAVLEIPANPGAGAIARARIVDSVRITASGFEPMGANPVCARRDCGTLDGSAKGAGVVGPDGGVAAGGRSLGVGALALTPDGKIAYVGALHSPSVSVLAIGLDGTLGPADQSPRIQLAEGAVGVTRLRLAVDPFGRNIDDNLAAFPGRYLGAFRMLFAFAADSSLRVVNVTGRLGRSPAAPFEFECDNTLAASGSNCPAVGSGARRQTFARGPGLRIPVSPAEVAPPIMRDLSFAAIVGDSDEKYEGVGYLLASNGQVYLLNLLSANPAGALDGGKSVGFRQLAREAATQPVVGAPFRTLAPPIDFPQPTRAAFESSFSGPRLESYVDEGPPVTLRWVSFPDTTQVSSQRWSVIWEDILTGTVRSTGTPVAGESQGSAGGIQDLGANFCSSGVQSGDVAMLTGCTKDAQCSLLGATCFQSVPGVPGLCRPRQQALDSGFRDRCGRLAGSRKRYEIVSASSGSLSLGLKLDEVSRPSIAPCDPGDKEATICRRASPQHGKFECRVFGERPRCVQPCNVGTPQEGGCRVGFLCEIPSGLNEGFCVEAPPLDPVCLTPAVPYRVHVGASFLVTGSAQPKIISTKVDSTTGLCVPDTTRDSVLSTRIPLSAPACVPGLLDDVATAAIHSLPKEPAAESQVGAGWGNPCLFKAPNFDESSEIQNSRSAKNEVPIKALFRNWDLRFVLTNLGDYTGDANTTAFDVRSAFVSERVEGSSGDVFVGLGVRILVAPTLTRRNDKAEAYFPHLFVIDQGRTSSFGSRGQILRVQPRTDRFPSGRYDSRYNQSTFPIQ